jgi:hypothetical protein
MKKNRSRKRQRRRRSFGGILSSLPKVHEDRNVDDIAKVTAALAARGIILDDPSYETVLHVASTSVILDTAFKTIAKATGRSENSIKKAYSVLNLLDLV